MNNNTNPKNIWYCHHYAFPPSKGRMANRAYYMADALNKQGHKVSLITSVFDHASGLKAEFQGKYKKERCDDVDFVWINTPQYHSNSLKRIINMLSFGKIIKSQQKQLVDDLGKPDIIICSSAHPFHFSACYKIAKKYSAKLIFEVRDLWPLSLIEIVGASKFHPLCLWVAMIEKKAYKKADAVVSLLEHADKYMVTKGLDQKKFHWIPNGYTEPKKTIMPADDADYQKIIELKKQGKFIIGYTGAHGQPNHLDLLCEATKTLSDDSIQTVVIGDGNLKSELLSKYADVKNLLFIEPKPKHSIAFFQLLFDVAYLGFHPKPLYRFGISANKMYEYMFNKVPVLTGKYPEGSTLIDRNNLGFIYDNHSADDLAKTITQIKSMPKQELVELGEKSHTLINQAFLYSILAEKYCQLFDDLSSN